MEQSTANDILSSLSNLNANFEAIKTDLNTLDTTVKAIEKEITKSR